MEDTNGTHTKGIEGNGTSELGVEVRIDYDEDHQGRFCFFEDTDAHGIGAANPTNVARPIRTYQFDHMRAFLDKAEAAYNAGDHARVQSNLYLVQMLATGDLAL